MYIGCVKDSKSLPTTPPMLDRCGGSLNSLQSILQVWANPKRRVSSNGFRSVSPSQLWRFSRHFSAGGAISSIPCRTGNTGTTLASLTRRDLRGLYHLWLYGIHRLPVYPLVISCPGGLFGFQGSLREPLPTSPCPIPHAGDFGPWSQAFTLDQTGGNIRRG